MRRLHHSRPARFVAAVLLVAALLGSPHARQDDAACVPVASSEHDASKHALGTFDAVHLDHCAVCHWLRGLKPTFAAEFGGRVELKVSGAIAAAGAVPHTGSIAPPLPARAPPSSSL